MVQESEINHLHKYPRVQKTPILKSAIACDLLEAGESLETNIQTETETESADTVKQSGLGAESDMNVTIDSIA